MRGGRAAQDRRTDGHDRAGRTQEYRSSHTRLGQRASRAGVAERRTASGSGTADARLKHVLLGYIVTARRAKRIAGALLLMAAALNQATAFPLTGDQTVLPAGTELNEDA